MKWRPIKSAPKDGTLVLGFENLCIRGDGSHGWAIPVQWVPSGRWQNCARGLVIYPTHWVPMPTGGES